MIVTLEERGRIERKPRQARSLRLRVDPDLLPAPGHPALFHAPGDVRRALPPPDVPGDGAGTGRAGYGPEHQRLGLDPGRREGGMAWGGGEARQTVEEGLEAMEAGVKAFREEWGL